MLNFFIIQIFQAIKDEKKGKVDIYFCGAPKMAQEILKISKDFDFNFSKENFQNTFLKATYST